MLSPNIPDKELGQRPRDFIQTWLMAICCTNQVLYNVVLVLERKKKSVKKKTEAGANNT